MMHDFLLLLKVFALKTIIVIFLFQENVALSVFLYLEVPLNSLPLFLDLLAFEK